MEQGRILAIDYGEKRIGIAISDPLGITAQSLPTLANNSLKFEEIKKLAETKMVCEIVIGLPRRLNGTIGPAAENVQRFGDELAKHVAIPIVYWDEWFTTSEAEKLLISADKSRQKRKQVIDMVAAQLILQGYLDSKPGKQ